MLFKLLIPFTIAAVIGVRATPVFDFPDFIHRDAIPAGITVFDYNATAATLEAAEVSKLESRGSLEERDDCHGSKGCPWFVKSGHCARAANVRY